MRFRTQRSVITTKEKIFFAAIDLFATKGYAGTSVRDIADAVEIKPASIYNHFVNKDAILDTLIEFTNNAISAFYNRLEDSINDAACLNTLLDAIFKELEIVSDSTAYYGVAILSSEQFNNSKAHEALIHSYMRQGIELLDNAFCLCIDKGWAKEFDTFACASFVMNSVLAGMMARVNDSIGKDGAYNTTEMFKSLKLLLQRFLSA
jgi:AcrR family transcriptional regulator